MQPLEKPPEGTSRAAQPGVFHPPPTPEVGRVALTVSQQAGRTDHWEEGNPHYQPVSRPKPVHRPQSLALPSAGISRAHAYTDTNEEPTTRHSSSKIGHPTGLIPLGDGRGGPHSIALRVPTPRPRRLIPGGKTGRWPTVHARTCSGDTDSVQEAVGLGEGWGKGRSE